MLSWFDSQAGCVAQEAQAAAGAPAGEPLTVALPVVEPHPALIDPSLMRLEAANHPELEPTLPGSVPS